MHVQSVHTQVKGRQIHALKHFHERLTLSSLHMNYLFRILFHGSFYKTQQVLLVHAGRGMYVCVNLQSNSFRLKILKSDSGLKKKRMTVRRLRRSSCLVHLTDIVKVTMRDFLLCCQLFHLIQQDVHLEL